MRKVGLLVVGALALVAFSGSGAFAQGTTVANQVNVTMNEQNGSGESGTATLSESNGQLMVTINLSNGTSTPQPAHIHEGTCANLNPKPLYPLNNVVNGKSDTTLNMSMATLQTGQTLAINVHKSAAEASTYVSCGDIFFNSMNASGPSGGTTTGGTTSGGTGTTTPGMPTTGAGDQGMPLVVIIFMALGLFVTGLRLVRRKA